MKNGQKIDLGLTGYDELFMTEQERHENRLPKIYDIPLSEIDDFPNHPFKVRLDEDMDQLIQSVKDRGVIVPITLRQKEDGRYEIVSGHRRRKACELAGFDTIRAEIKDLTRDEAIILMVESNLQRSVILPSEKAFSYKMRLDAMKRQGQRTDLTSRPVGDKLDNLRSGEIIGLSTGESERQVQRYIRLTELIPTLLDIVDEGRIGMRPAVELSYLSKEEQSALADAIEFTLEQKNENDYTMIGTYLTDADGKITVEDLTEGATYRLSETVPEGYIGETPVQEFIAHLGMNSVSFANRLIRGNLRIVKVDKATQTPLEGAGFRVFNTDGEAVAEGYTDENGEVSFEQLAYGEYTYQEFEAPAGFVLDDEVYNFSILEDGVEVVKQHDNQPKEGSITIYKVDEAGRALPGVTFLLEYSVDGGKTWAPIQYRDAKDDVLAGYCTSDGLNQGKLVTGDDGHAVFTGLCIDTQLGEVRYRVTETATKNGYNLLPDCAFDGSLSEDEEIEVSFTVVNQPEFKMPATGGGGFIGTAIAVALAGIAAGAMLFVMIKRRKAE